MWPPAKDVKPTPNANHTSAMLVLFNMDYTILTYKQTTKGTQVARTHRGKDEIIANISPRGIVTVCKPLTALDLDGLADYMRTS